MDDVIRQKISTFFAEYPIKHFDKGQLLIQAYESPAGIYHMLEGQVRQYDVSAQGNEIVVNIFKPPAFFPMAWAITGMPNRYFFDAAMPVEAHLAPPDSVVAFLKQNPDVLFDLLSRLYSGVEGIDYMSLRGPAGVIYDIVVDPDYRQQGVGRVLIDATLEALKGKGSPRVVLSTAERNAAAQRLFDRAGFRRTMIEMTRELS